MLPTLLLVGVGTRRRTWLPLPAFLLWPFWLLGWVPWLVLKAARVSLAEPWRMALMLGVSLSGLRLDVDSVDGTSIHIRLI